MTILLPVVSFNSPFGIAFCQVMLNGNKKVR